MAVRRRAVFMDKDGTLIEDLPYNVDPSRIRLAATAGRALRRLGACGYGVVVVTNQSGVARGYFTMAALRVVRDHLARTLRSLGSELIGFHVCPHLPARLGEEVPECVCRKPAPGLLRAAAAEHDLRLSGSWFIGDTWMDVAAGRAAGCRTILVGPDALRFHAWPVSRWPDVAVATLDQAVSVILESSEQVEDEPMEAPA